MSANIIEYKDDPDDEYKDDPDVPNLPCSACIEAAAEKNGGLALENGLQKYNFYQLKTHLESNAHNQKDFVSVTLRASIHLYRVDSAYEFWKIGL